MDHIPTSSTIRRIAFIGNYMPRQCGIATFTTDLCEAIATEYDGTTCIALPVNDIEAGYAYPDRVRFELTEKDLSSYLRAADFLHTNNVDLVCLQHEYGIYGGRAGSHVLALLRELHMPIVTTLHTILRDPDPEQRRVLQEIAALSDRLVVMSARGAEFLQEVYQVSGKKIDLIPHGIPDVPFVDPSFHKDLFGVEGKTVLLSFGLLSANKGIENVIAALPDVLVRHPNVVYIILGATHPHVKRDEGEKYRLSLQRLAKEKGVEEQVIFYNQFVSLEELIEFIGAADIYITPYLNQAQIVSGTLAYTLGAGKAVISTPYWYAEEMLADERGALVPFHDPKALADQVIDLLDNEAKRHAMRKRAYLFGRNMVWPQVARRYMESFERARSERRHFSLRSLTVKAMDEHPGELPPLKLDHLRHMADETGMLQHAIFTVPNYHHGYTTDDNTRALMVSYAARGVGQRGRAGACFPLSRFRLVRLQHREQTVSQLHGLPAPLAGRQRFRRLPWSRVMGTRYRIGPLEHACPPQHGGLVVRESLARHSRDDEPARVGFRAHRNPRISQTVCRRPRGEPGPRRVGEAVAGAVSRTPNRRMALV